MSDFHVPLPSELTPVATAVNRRPDLKPFIERALREDETMKAVLPYKHNGSISGRRAIDDVRILDIVLRADDHHGGNIRSVMVPAEYKDGKPVTSTKGYNEAEVVNAINVVLRRFYELNDKGRIVGVNEKRYALLAHKAAE